MRFPFRRMASLGVTAALVALVVCLPFAASASSAQDAVPPVPTTGDTAAAASLHNPNLDNGDWYEFDHRYQGAYLDGVWLPDDDNNTGNNIPASSLQDWRLWFQNGTIPILTRSTSDLYFCPGRPAHYGEAVCTRTGWDGKYLAGLYQAVYNTTPCLTYQFQMYAQSRPEGSDDTLVALQVGIDRVGWHPDSTTDPAVHTFPSTTVWGSSSNTYKWSYGLLSVITDALSSAITVFTYGDANGGQSHWILWDTGSLQDVTPGLISDPNNPPAATIGSVTAITSTTSATVTWSTTAAALGQVYYHQVSCPSSPVSPTISMSHTIYLPLISRQVGWSATALNKTLLTSHSEAIGSLQAGCTYEYIVASRGLSGMQCVTWVSSRRTFTTAP